MLHQSCTV